MAQMVKNLPAMQETQIRSLCWEDPLEKGMATHSSTLAWRIPWTEEPSGLQSIGSQRVRHDGAITLTLTNLTSWGFCFNKRNKNFSKYFKQRAFIVKNWIHGRRKAEKPNGEEWGNSKISYSKKLKSPPQGQRESLMFQQPRDWGLPVEAGSRADVSDGNQCQGVKQPLPSTLRPVSPTGQTQRKPVSWGQHPLLYKREERKFPETNLRMNRLRSQPNFLFCKTEIETYLGQFLRA